MTRRALRLLAASGVAAVLCGRPPTAAAQDATPATASADANVSSATVPAASAPYPTTVAAPSQTHPGNISFNFPAADPRDLAKIVLGDMLKQTYIVQPEVTGSVTLVTAQPIAKEDVLGVFENALRASNLALLRQNGAYVIAPLQAARSQAAQLTPDQPGFGSETIALRFISAAEFKALLDPVVPDTVTVADPTRNLITVTGSTGQRQAVRDLVGQFDTDWLRGMSFALYVPKHTDSRIIVPEIDKLLNGDGAPSAGLVRLIVMDKINGVLAVSAQPQYLEDVKRWIEVLDHEGESSEPRLFVYRVQNGRSADLAAVLSSAFGGGGGARRDPASAAPASMEPASDGLGGPPAAAAPASGAAAGDKGGTQDTSIHATITSDETNNAVLVYTTPREYAVIEDALRQLDIAPMQVLIDAVITEVDLTHNLQYGVQWSFTGGKDSISLTPSSTSSSSSSSTGSAVASGFNWMYTSGTSIQATLNALSSLTKVDVLSAPELLVLNNHTASLEVGDQVPIVTASSVSTITANAPQVNSVDYRDTGVILKVTPRVNSGGLVLLDIAQEVSDVSTTTSSTINSPTIEERKFSSSIAVQDGQTVAIGGLIRDNASHGRSGVPILSAIPLLGALAGQKTVADDRTELIILLTPRVVRSTSDANAVTDELKRRIEAIAPLRPVNAFRP